ncbi:MAG: hypothetical protein H7Z41_07975 [Cytophagales bacterium]|nr:hypothetical protein [Armatimonadota bacterium]
MWEPLLSRAEVLCTAAVLMLLASLGGVWRVRAARRRREKDQFWRDLSYRVDRERSGSLG